MVRVAEDGSVCTARTVASEMPASVDACVLRALDAAAYPAPAGGCREMIVPLSFAPNDTK